MEFTGNAKYLRWAAVQQHQFEEYQKAIGKTTPYLRDLSSNQMLRAADIQMQIETREAELQKLPLIKELTKLRKELAAILKVKASKANKATKASNGEKRRNNISPEGRKRIAAAAKARWAKVRAAKSKS